MAFLEKTELRTRSHIEIIDAITRSDDTIIDIIISESIAFMKSYLSSRYDCAVVFAQSGDNRDQVVVKILKNIVIYEIYSSHNPQMMTQVVKDNYDQAISWLKGVQKSTLNPDLPALSSADGQQGYFRWGGNTKRENHY